VKLPREFYTRAGVLAVARDLLGQRLVVPAPDGTRVAGIIVETEAYRGPADRASHAFGGRRTRRTETMFSVGGTAYVYFVYGMHHQFNVVTGVANVPHAVLVRALEPLEGIDIMRRRRGVSSDRELTNGPGKLCQALGIDRELDAADLLGSRVWIESGDRAVRTSAVARGPRVGIDYAGPWAAMPWRFWLRDSAFVSRPGRPDAAPARPGARPVTPHRNTQGVGSINSFSETPSARARRTRMARGGSR
jgi:DNA-3-methyladenine glycosylase